MGLESPVKQIFQDNSLGYCYLTPDLRICEYNKVFVNHLKITDEPEGRSVFQIVPEFTGMESIFDELINKTRRKFNLERINRLIDQDKIKYIDFSIYPTQHSETPIVLIVRDSSPTTIMQQQLNQQKYEILLLQNKNYADSNLYGSKLLGNSEAIKKVQNQITYVARVPKATILLEGESGTGKSMVAKILHAYSFEENRPFVEINCAAIPETLLEAELFGYEKGAFTHAIASKPGLLEEADGGTLFLDEIGEMPPKIQVKLLTFLETRKFRRLGSNKEVKVEIKLITATNQDLLEQVKNKIFREDLYYRLNVVNIVLPPLREIGRDIISIAEHFIQVFNIDFNKNISGFTDEATQALLSYEWPGNVRELRNTVERAMIFSNEEYITRDDITTFGLQHTIQSVNGIFSLPPDGIIFEELERNILNDALRLANNNQTKAAKLLHMSRDTFRYRLEKHGIINT